MRTTQISKAVLSNMMLISCGLHSVLHHCGMNHPRVWVYPRDQRGKYKCCYQITYSEAYADVFAVLDSISHADRDDSHFLQKSQFMALI